MRKIKKQNYIEHIKIERLEDEKLSLSVYGDAYTLTTMLYNAMKSNRYLADVVLETVIFYTTYENNKVNLN